MRLAFKCRVCGSEKLPCPELRYDCFVSHTHCHETEWSDLTENPPALEEQHWERSEILPEQGEQRLIKVHYPFCCKTGENFRTLFQPALSAINGFGEPPEELNQSAIITCRLDNILSRNEHEAWISVTVTEMILLSDLCRYYPAHVRPELFEAFQSHNPHSVQCYPFSWQNWKYDCWTAQGDVGEWKLFFTDETGKKHLILLETWGMCDSMLYIGNIVEKSDN